MNYLNRRNAQDTYYHILNGARKEIPSLLKPYINTIRLVGTVYDYNNDTKEWYQTIHSVSYSRSFIDFLVTLASIKKDYKILNMYEKKYQNNPMYDAREIRDLVESRVPDFDFNNPVFKKLILGVKTMCNDFNCFKDVNELVRYVTNKYGNELSNETLLEMVYKGFITKEDLEELKNINPALANFYLMNYEFIKRYNLSLVRKR